MRKFENGIEYFTPATLTIYFPEDDVCCGHCPLCYKDNLDRPRCSFNNRLVYSKEYALTNVCPLVFERSNEDA